MKKPSKQDIESAKKVRAYNQSQIWAKRSEEDKSKHGKMMAAAKKAKKNGQKLSIRIPS